jgi:hypothetical protein
MNPSSNFGSSVSLAKASPVISEAVPIAKNSLVFLEVISSQLE